MCKAYASVARWHVVLVLLLLCVHYIEMRSNCGNKIVEEDEECDCGTFKECALDQCCDGLTCKLKSEAQCASGACCDQCRLRPKDYICRDSHNECDLPEYCDGENGHCPMDVYKKNGSPCGHTKAGISGYCFQGDCPTLDLQCESIWGYGGSAADRHCYVLFNSKGSINGHCGRDANEHYIKCQPENVQCGTLHCKEGERQPINTGIDQLYARTIILIQGLEFECKSTSGEEGSNDYPKHGLVKDGTPCGNNLICLNQTCVSLFPHIDQTKYPTNKKIEMRSNCGNKIVEEDEECDCGTFKECALDQCCDGLTCKLKSEAQCASGACCDQCRLRPKDYICRDSHNECDLPEYCDGENGHCPMDVYKKNGSPCGHTKAGISGYCFQGDCPTLDLQCKSIWGYGGSAAIRHCYEQFNSRGSINGHCGRDANEHYIKCQPENVQCGTLQCKEGESQPINTGIDQLYMRIAASINGLKFECKSTSGEEGSNEYPKHGLVKDGTPCGNNLICLNQTCVSLFPHIDQTKCPTNKHGHECSERFVIAEILFALRPRGDTAVRNAFDETQRSSTSKRSSE